MESKIIKSNLDIRLSIYKWRKVNELVYIICPSVCRVLPSFKMLFFDYEKTPKR